MPSSTNAAQGGRTRIDPATATVEELIAHLSTDPVAGLSPKEAERRVSARDPAPLFRKTPRRFAACLRLSLRDPALWLLLAVSVISLFFERIALGLTCTFLAMGNALLCAWFLYRSDRIDSAMQVYDTPLCRVLRGHRILRVSGDGICMGDVILLSKGDIVAADCRLLRTDGFAVTERELDAKNVSRPPVRLSKDADAQPDPSEVRRLSPVNMVYAGGMVESGTALAVAVAVGRDTHVGGLLGYVPSAHAGRPVSYFGRSTRALSLFNLALFCLILPLTAIGIFTVGARYEFLDIFLSALALASLTLTEHLLAKGGYMATATRRAAATDRDSENTAEIKSSATSERLTAMTDLILLGTAALHDGGCHPEALYVGNRVYRCDSPDADDEARAVAEYLYMYRRGAASLPLAGHAADHRLGLLSDLCEWAELDSAALAVKIKEIRAEGAGVSGIFPTAEGNRRVTAILTDRFDEVETCTHICDAGGSRPADRDALSAAYRTYREAVRKGSTPLFLITESKGERALRAMLTYVPHTCRKTEGCVRNLEAAGIRVTAMLHDVSDSHTRVLAACGLTARTAADRPAPEGEERTPAAVRIAAGCRAFEGCSEDYVLACIRDLKAQGRTVGVLSGDADDVYILSEADVAFTCAPSLYATAEEGVACLQTYGGEKPSADEDGHPDSAVATDRARRTAHVILRRSSPAGGGVLGVLRALQAADSFKDALDCTLRFTLLSQALRVIMTVLPLCLGLSPAAAPVLLISGLFVDLLVLSAALGFPLRPTPARRRALDAGLTRPHVTFRHELVAVAVGSVLPWIVAGVASLTEADFGGDLVFYGLLCTLALQLAIFFTSRLPRRDSSTFLTGVALALVYVGALAASLVSRLAPLWALVLPFIGPVAYLLMRALLLAVDKAGSRNRPTLEK